MQTITDSQGKRIMSEVKQCKQCNYTTNVVGDLAMHRKANHGQVVAIVSNDVAAWLDPSGTLQKAGLMKVNCYSDHNEDIRTKGSCDYCYEKEIQ